MRSSHLLLLASLALTSSPQLLSGQSIRGRVVDARSNQPITAVDLVLIGADSARLSHVLADTAGRFRLLAPGGGSFWIKASRIGYAEVTLGPVELDSAAHIEVQLSLHTRAVALSGLVVTSEARSRWLDQTGFYDRRKLGFGRFIDRAAIEKRSTSRAHHLLQGVPGVRTLIHQRTGKPVVLLRSGIASTRAGHCTPRIFRDGVEESNSGGDLFDWEFYADELEAIEVYASVSSVPPQYGGPMSGCGVILMWTRRGG